MIASTICLTTRMLTFFGGAEGPDVRAYGLISSSRANLKPRWASPGLGLLLGIASNMPY